MVVAIAVKPALAALQHIPHSCVIADNILGHLGRWLDYKLLRTATISSRARKPFNGTTIRYTSEVTNIGKHKWGNPFLELERMEEKRFHPTVNYYAHLHTPTHKPAASLHFPLKLLSFWWGILLSNLFGLSWLCVRCALARVGLECATAQQLHSIDIANSFRECQNRQWCVCACVGNNVNLG